VPAQGLAMIHRAFWFSLLPNGFLAHEAREKSSR